MNLFKSIVGVMAAAIAASAAAVGAAGSATIDRSRLERSMLDTCIYRQFEVEGVNRRTMVDDCRCAVKAAMQGMAGDSFPTPRSGGLTADQDRAIRTGIAACFRS